MSVQADLVTGVDFLTVPTRDVEAARRFYGEALGLRAGKLWQRGEGPPRGAEFETGTVTIAVVDPAALGREFRTSSQPIAFRVDDVAQARAALEAKGVEFAGETIDSGVCHLAIFRDPDGNVLMLHHRYAPPE